MMPLWTTTILPGAVAVGMRVLLGRPAVRRPARVADAVVAGDRVGVDDVFEVRQLAGAAAQVDGAVAHDRHARRVVAAVLELPQAVDQHGHDVLRSDVSDDSAHGWSPDLQFRLELRLQRSAF